MNNPDTAYKNALTKVRWPHPKRSFGVYKSASIHQKVKFRIPKPLIILIFCILSVAYLGFSIYQDHFINKPAMARQSQVAQPSQPQQPQPSSPSTLAAPQAPPEEPDIRERFIPRVYGEPNTAPAYDHLRQVVSIPVVTACIADAERCLCYTQQMTKVEMTDGQCRQHATRGVFDPYRDATEERAVRGEHVAEPAPPTES
ncbi:hypothetical protein D3C85_1236960 [compost metagenome]